MNICAKSELMKNHVAGKPLPAQRVLAVAATSQQEPMLFALDTNHNLTLTLPSDDSTTGWAQMSLSAQLAHQFNLGVQPVVQAFALAQDADGAMWLVLAAATAVGQPSQVFLSPKMPNSGLASDWAGFGACLVARAVPANLVVSQLTLGNGDDTGAAPLIVAVAKGSDGMVMHYQINPDPNNSSWTCLPLLLPQNATQCLAAVVGNAPGFGRGVYALCQLGTGVNLTFTTQPEVFGGHPVSRSIELALPDGLNPVTIAALSTQNGQTELYVGGQGIYRYPVSAQTESNLPGAWVADAILCTGVAQLVVARDQVGQEISVWAENASDLLVHTVGTLSGADYTWQTPVYLATEVTALAGYRDVDPGTSLTTSAMAVGKSDGSLALLVQDPESTLWRPQTVSLPITDTALELSTYTTRITVLDEDNVAWSNQTVQIQPSADCATLVNGQYYALKASAPKPVQTNQNGIITIVLETPDIAAPVFHLLCNGQMLSTDPGENIKTQLRGINSGSQIANAQRSDGQPLFPKGANETDCDNAATALQRLMQAHDSLPSDGSAKRAAARPRLMTAAARPALKSSFGIRFTPNGTVALHHDVAAAALAAPRGGVNEFWVAAGELFETLASGTEAVGQFFINELENAWEFMVDLGNRVLKFIFEVASQAMAAVNWVFERVLGISLDDIIAWLGFVFNWGDILKNHRAIANIINLGFAKAVADVNAVEQKVIDSFVTVRSLVLNNQLIIDQSNAIFADRARRSPGQSDPTTDSPQSNWGNEQLQNNGSAITFASSAIGDLAGVLKNLTDDEIQTIENAVDQAQTLIVDNFSSMTWGQILDTLLQIVGAAILNTVENVALTFLEAVQVVVQIIRAILNARWDIPVVTYVYEEIICQGDGSQLTMLDVIALLTAIPTTVLYKAVVGKNLFTDTQAQAISNAASWDAMMTAMMAPTPAPRLEAAVGTAASRALVPNRHLGGASAWAQRVGLPTTAARAATDDEAARLAGAIFQLLAAVTRSVAAVLFAAREVSPEPLSDRFNEVKHGFDWATYIFSIANMTAVLTAVPNSSAARVVIDSTVTSFQILARIKDSILIGYKRKTGSAPPALKKGLCYGECAFGVAIVGAVCASIALEAQEDTPPNISPATWKMLLSYKFIQNCLTGLYRFLSPVSVAQGNVKVYGQIARGAMLVIRGGASLGRGAAEVTIGAQDLDD